jgi:hypothetical protein
MIISLPNGRLAGTAALMKTNTLRHWTIVLGDQL